jgi:hypothetical protein
MLTEYSGASNTRTSTISPGRMGPKPRPAPDDGPLGVNSLKERVAPGKADWGVDCGKMGSSGAFDEGFMGAGVI